MAESKPPKKHRIVGPTEILFLIGLVCIFTPFILGPNTDSRIRVGMIILGLVFMISTSFLPERRKPKR
jgi:hypothetical protein